MRIVIAAALTIAALPALAQPMPPYEAAVIKVVDDARTAYKGAANDLAKGKVRVDRDNALCALARRYNTVANWTATVKRLDSTSAGWGVLKVEIAPGITIGTTNNSFSDSVEHTLIDPASKVFAAAAALQKGQTVLVSGSFLGGGKTCIVERSLTQQGSIEEPEFAFRFTNVRPAA